MITKSDFDPQCITYSQMNLIYNSQIYFYINLIDQFVTAQLENDPELINETLQQLFQNADERAALIDSVNPYWSGAQWRNLIRNNVRTTIDESTTFLSGDYALNIQIFSSLLYQSENMSNAFADGLFRYLNPQIPEQS